MVKTKQTLVQIGHKFYTLKLKFTTTDFNEVKEIIEMNKVLLTYNPRKGKQIQ